MKNLIIDVSDLLAVPGSKKEINISDELIPLQRAGEEIKFVGPVKLDLILENVSSGILVKGFLTGEVTLSCSRCLTEFNLALSSEAEDVFYLALAAEEGKKRAFEEEQEDEGILRVIDRRINLADLAKPAFLLAIPIKPLCSETCQGLCPMCGQNLNEGKCGCKVETGDLRLAELKKLLEE